MTLAEVEKHFAGTIEKFDGPAEWVERLEELGLYCGQKINVHDRLPFGGPVIIQIEGTFLALREEEARCLVVR